MVTRRGHPSKKYAHIYTYINQQTQSGDFEITNYYMLQKPHMGSKCKYNQYDLLIMSMGDKNN